LHKSTLPTIAVTILIRGLKLTVDIVIYDDCILMRVSPAYNKGDFCPSMKSMIFSSKLALKKKVRPICAASEF